MESVKKFPQEKFYVSHFTQITRLRNIIEARALQPTGMSKASGHYTEQAKDKKKYKRSVFYSVMFPDDDGVPIFKDNLPVPGFVYFVFSPKIIEDNANMVGKHGVKEGPIWCKGWNYGKIHEHCYYYEKDKSLSENLHTWRDLIQDKIDLYKSDPNTEKLTSVESRTLNTELLMEGEMPIDMDLLHIYIPKVIYKPIKYSEAFLQKYPLMRGAEERMRKNYEEEEAEVERLIKENPDLPWTRENPFE
jgi:hypothetical protein